MTQTPALPELSPLATYIESDAWRDAWGAWLMNHPNEGTRSGYHNDWVQFLDVVQCDIADVTQSIMIKYKNWLQDEGYAATTVHRKLAALSSFYNFAMHERGLTDVNPCQGVTRPAYKKYGKAKYLTSDEQVKQLLSSIERETIEGKRDYAIIVFFLSTAVRSAVAQNLRVKDIVDIESGIFKTMEFKNKGGADRTLQLPQMTQDAIADYLRTRDNLTPDSFVFVTLFHEKRLQRSTLNKMIKRRLRDAGLPANLTIHSMRHTSIREAEKDGWTLSDLMAFSGHEDPATLTIYLHTISPKRSDIAAKLVERFE